MDCTIGQRRRSGQSTIGNQRRLLIQFSNSQASDEAVILRPPGLASGEPDDRLQRSIQYAANVRFHRRRLGLLDRPLSLMMTKSNSSLRAKRSNPFRNIRSKSGLLRRFAPRNDVANPKHSFAFSRRESPELCLNVSPNKGRGAPLRRERGMPGARCTRSRVREV